MKKPATSATELKQALLSLKPLVRRAVFFSFFTNLLVIVPMIYMLEVYDRVVNSGSMMTLAMETIAVLGALLLMEALEWVRSGILQRAGLKLDESTGARTFNAVFEANLRRLPGISSQALNDLRVLRDFIGSPGMIALIDLPLAMIYMVAIFVISPMMGWMAMFGALLQVAIAWFNERSTQPPLTAANRAAIEAQNYASNSLRNAQVIEAMGMQRNIHGLWMKKQHEFLALQADASDKAGAFSAAAKFVQLTQSSLLLGLGGWLMLRGEFTGGGGLMIVASSLGSRVLSPLVQLIATWKNVIGARDAYQRLDSLLTAIPQKEPGMPLPPPVGALTVENVVAAAPGAPTASILRGVSFAVPAGKVMAIVGPSASGKTTLARLLMGIWPAASGKVRLDGVDVHTWNKTELGPHVGYLPQEVELFDGTLAENIARFGEVDMSKVEAAARAVGVHETLMALPQGYETRIGDEGCFLSGGQRQRVGLARAIYGNPRFIVLDEPNSSLDEAGELALVQTLQGLKLCGITVIVITHRTNVLIAADLMLILHEGQVKACGPRDEVLAALQRNAQQAAASAATPAVATAAARPAVA
jgi:ATP-binding cassette subfamily C exporter for protease/lipase